MMIDSSRPSNLVACNFVARLSVDISVGASSASVKDLQAHTQCL